ncbi:MAG: MFS transporter [Neisseria sp.]|nr:MFS transporter [Neisseria sp.]
MTDLTHHTQSFFHILGTALLLALGGLSVVGQLYLPLPLLSSLKTVYPDMVYPEAWTVSAFGLMYAVGFLFFGPLSDAFGRKRVLLTSLFLLAFISLMVAWAEDAVLLLLARAFQGFVAAGFPPAALAYISASFPERYRSAAVSAMAFSFLSAVALAQVFVLLLATQDFRLPEMLLAVFYAVLGVSLWRLLAADSSRQKREPYAVFSAFKSLPNILLSRSLSIYYMVSVTVLLVFVGFYLLLAQSDIEWSALALRLWTLPFLLSCFAVPKAASRWGHHRVLVGAFLFGSVALGMAWAGYALSVVVLTVFALCLLSSAVALMVPALIGVMAAHSEHERRGSAVALYTFVLFCGASIAPLGVSWLLHHMAATLILMILTAIFCTCFFMLWSWQNHDSKAFLTHRR